VKVTHAAAANALPVAEFTLAAILFSNKRVLEFRRLYAEGRPGRIPLMDQPIGNLRKAVGIVGASRIGRRVIELLRPFDFDLLLYDPYVARTEADVLGVTLTGLDELVATADIVSLHAPSLTATRHMIDARRLRLMRDGATLINTARGRLVDHAALEAELVTGRINAVIDVTEPEILPRTSPLYDLPNVLLTPHIAGALGIERERLGALIVVELERYVRGEPLQHAIEPRALERIA
jgi:phosphoglycerate dehydrogenase-like enzyme